MPGAVWDEPNSLPGSNWCGIHVDGPFHVSFGARLRLGRCSRRQLRNVWRCGAVTPGRHRGHLHHSNQKVLLDGAGTGCRSERRYQTRVVALSWSPATANFNPYSIANDQNRLKTGAVRWTGDPEARRNPPQCRQSCDQPPRSLLAV